MQTLELPTDLDPEEEINIREAVWWHLSPGQIGYNQPIWAYCGFTEEAWQRRRMERGWR